VLLIVFGVVLATWATGSTIRADVKLASKDLQDKMKSYTARAPRPRSCAPSSTATKRS
jgi:hypothetical protein